MNFLLSILIFIAILFLYVHINDQLKKGQDLEIYEADYTTNAALQDILGVKQPVIFDLQKVAPQLFANSSIDALFTPQNKSYIVNVKDATDYFAEPKPDSIDSFALSFSSALALIRSDAKARYFSENNSEFLDEITDLDKKIGHLDDLLKPPLTIHRKCDLVWGADQAYTPLRFHSNYRRFMTVLTGKISVKMTPYKSTKYLSLSKDYDNYEFWSPVNALHCQEKYRPDFEKVKFLEFDVYAGNALYIPAYWWYSVKFNNADSETMVLENTYINVMNAIANIPDIARYYLQQQNITQTSGRSVKTKPAGDKPSDSAAAEAAQPANKEPPINVDSVKIADELKNSLQKLIMSCSPAQEEPAQPPAQEAATAAVQPRMDYSNLTYNPAVVDPHPLLRESSLAAPEFLRM
jgi:hypothetical protein